MFGQRHHESGRDQRAGQIGVHPGAAAGAMRDDNQPAIALHGGALPGQLQREGAALNGFVCFAGWVEHRDGAATLGAGKFHQTHTRVACHGG